MTDIGPVQLIAIGFGPEAPYEGQILDELERLEVFGRIRVLDLLFVGKDVVTGEVVAFDYQGDELGGVVGALLGFPFSAREPVVIEAPAGELAVGLTRPLLGELLRAAPPDVAIGLVLIEHVWARDFKQAIRDAGGVPLFEGLLAAETMGLVAAELEDVVSRLDEAES